MTTVTKTVGNDSTIDYALCGRCYSKETFSMATAPESIRSHKEAGVLEIKWADGPAYQFPFKFLRCECPCAACVNEFTGEKMLDPATVPEDVTPVNMTFSGNYALKIHWSDEHFTGLYSWDRLSQLAESPEVVQSIG